MSDDKVMELCVVLNKDKGDINYLKLSRILNEFYEPDSHDMNQEELGEKFGYSRSTIALVMPFYP